MNVRFILLFSIFVVFKNYSQKHKEKIVKDTINSSMLLDEVNISSSKKSSTDVYKIGIKTFDLPQATAIIGQTTFKNQQINSITDLLKNINGVYIMGTTGGIQEEISSRGYSLGNSNTFKNGVRYFNGSNGTGMKTELSGVETAEFLKGNAAILYGNVSPGGVLNFVTKKPKFNFGGEVGFNFGSFETIKPTFDIYGPINKKIAYRINSSYQKANSFKDYVESETFYINPSFIVKFAEHTKLTIEGDYLKDERTPDFGAGIINYEIINLPRNQFNGFSWGKNKAEQSSITATFHHHFSDNLELTSLTGYRSYYTDLHTNARPNSSAASSVLNNGNWTRKVFKNNVKDDYFIQQFDLTTKFNTGKILHQVLFGSDFENYKTNTTTYDNSQDYDIQPINIFEKYDVTKYENKGIQYPDKLALTSVPVNRFGIYFQDLISINKYVKFLTGLRYSYQETESNNIRYDGKKPNPTTEKYDNAFSPKVALIIQPTKNHSIFASYSNSFQVNTGIDINNKPLKPSIIDQYEIGIKNNLLKDKLYINLTAYQINNNNLAQSVIGKPEFIELAGATKSQGVELDIVTHPIKNLSIITGYSFNETKYTKSNIYIVGSELKYNPKNTANLSLNYKFTQGKLNGFYLGLINSYVGERFAGRSTRLTINNDKYKLIQLNDYYQLDATIGFVTQKWSIRTKLSNIFNELNYNLHDDNSVNPIAPRNYSVSINYIF